MRLLQLPTRGAETYFASSTLGIGEGLSNLLAASVAALFLPIAGTGESQVPPNRRGSVDFEGGFIGLNGMRRVFAR